MFWPAPACRWVFDETWVSILRLTHSITWGSKIRVIWQALMKTCSGSGCYRSGLNVIFQISPSHSQERADWCRGGGGYLDYKMDHICESIYCIGSMRMILGSIWNGSEELSALSLSTRKLTCILKCFLSWCQIQEQLSISNQKMFRL